jgi:hypothetical protein
MFFTGQGSHPAGPGNAQSLRKSSQKVGFPNWRFVAFAA